MANKMLAALRSGEKTNSTPAFGMLSGRTQPLNNCSMNMNEFTPFDNQFANTNTFLPIVDQSACLSSVAEMLIEFEK